MEPFQVEYQLTEEDVVAAVKSSEDVSSRFLVHALVVVPAAAAAVGFWLSPDWAPGFLVYPVMAAAAFWPYLRGGRTVFRQNREAYEQPLCLRVDERGYGIVARDGSFEIRWKAVQRWREGSVFLIYPQRNIFHMVPKRALDEAQIESLRGYLLREVGPEGAWRKKLKDV